MYKDHYPAWVVMIDRMHENDLLDKTILDFGCNQGGFLHVLFSKKPFKLGIGVDLAIEDIQTANAQKKELPVEYQAVDNLSHLKEIIDIAFSHEVFYLIDDLESHAREMYTALKKKGIYYASLGCHSNNPMWENWKQMIEKTSNIKPHTYTLNFITDTFRKYGFVPYAQKFKLSDFILAPSGGEMC
jgi:SAM-dependent methyltransferase